MYIIRVDVDNTDFSSDFADDIYHYCVAEGLDVSYPIVREWCNDKNRVSFVAYEDDLETMCGLITGHYEEDYSGKVLAWIDGLFGTNSGANLLATFEAECKKMLVQEIHLCTFSAGLFIKRQGFDVAGLHMVKKVNG